MSTKYGDKSNSRLVEDEIALTNHAIARFRERTPHGSDITPHAAWRLGEWVKHPQVAQSDGEPEPPDRVRLYMHGEDSHEWGVAFLVTSSDNPRPDAAANVVATVIDVNGFDHGPARAYLHSHGPHTRGGGR